MERGDRNLDSIRIAKNCPASWGAMCGTDRVRHCTHCNRKVYNLSNMTREEAGKVVFDTEGSVCVRFYRRKDGKMMTRDCGRAVRAGMGIKVAASAVLSVFGIALFTPVMGSKASPETLVKAYRKRLKNISEELKKATTHEERQLLVDKQKQTAEMLADALAETGRS